MHKSLAMLAKMNDNTARKYPLRMFFSKERQTVEARYLKNKHMDTQKAHKGTSNNIQIQKIH